MYMYVSMERIQSNFVPFLLGNQLVFMSTDLDISHLHCMILDPMQASILL